ncbi:MAG: hypothetical protein VKK04_02540 [Synechococcales bacterium]|nr:hypothetical protein [Synechococcales bacterium]
MKGKLSDIEVIQQFIQRSVQNQEVLAANQNLQALSVCSTNQLVNRQGITLASIQLNQASPEFSIWAKTPYWESLNEQLAYYNFVVSNQAIQHDFYRYCHVKPPQGYQMRCTRSVELWRRGWKYRNRIRSQFVSLDLLVRVRQTWYPVNNLEISNGLIFIKTLTEEMSLQTSDLIVWLEKAV